MSNPQERLIELHRQRMDLERQEGRLLVQLLEQLGLQVSFLGSAGEGLWSVTIGFGEGVWQAMASPIAAAATEAPRAAALPAFLPPGLGGEPVSDRLPPAPAAPAEAAAAPPPVLAGLPTPVLAAGGRNGNGGAKAPAAPAAPAVVAEEEGEEREVPLVPPTSVVPAVAPPENDWLIGEEEEQPATPAPVAADPAAPVVSPEGWSADAEPSMSLEDLRDLAAQGADALRIPDAGPARANHFRERSTDLMGRAVRLARTLVGDMIAYRPDEHREAMDQGPDALRETFGSDLDRSRRRFDESMREMGLDESAVLGIFEHAVNEVLGHNQEILEIPAGAA